MPARFTARTAQEIEELRFQVADWSLVQRESILRLERKFRFSNFVEGLSFTQRAGALAEVEGHVCGSAEIAVKAVIERKS